MKKIVYILIAAACALSVSGCSERDIDVNTNGGQGLEFLHFASSTAITEAKKDKPASHAFAMSVGITSLSNKDRTFNLKVGSKTTGVEDTDFRMPNKTITIPAGKYTAVAGFEIDYENISEEGFVIELVLDVEAGLISPSYGNSCVVTVMSDKVIIDWTWLAGQWKASDNGAPTYPILIEKVDETHLTITNFWDGGEMISAEVDFVARTIAIAPNQMIYDYPDYGPVFLRYCDPKTEVADPTMPIRASMSALGIAVELYNVYLPATDDDFGNGTTAMTR